MNADRVALLEAVLRAARAWRFTTQPLGVQRIDEAIRAVEDFDRQAKPAPSAARKTGKGGKA